MKKTIKIAHLYYDLLNLYGESGNVMALKRFIERVDIETEIHFLTIGDKIDFNKFDIIFIGQGSEENQKLVIEDILKYKKDIEKAIENEKVFIATGNAMEIFGKKIRKYSGVDIKCLDIFPYSAVEEKDRLVYEVVYNYNKLDNNKGKKFLGFKNCNCNITNNKDNRMFEYSDSFEYKNFYGMNFVGPVLIRNPYFTNYILEKVFKQKDIDIKLKEDTTEFVAYHNYIDNIITKD